VKTELTLTPPLSLTDTGALHLTLTDTEKLEYIDCYATLITESTTSVPPDDNRFFGLRENIRLIVPH